MLKLTIKDKKKAVVRFNHPTEIKWLIDLLMKKKGDPTSTIKIKIRDEREQE